MSSNKPRYLHDNKDMIMTLLPLIIISFIIAGIASQCSFNPGAPQAGQVPTFDVEGALQYDADTLNFPIRIPQVPEGWQANSGSREDTTGEGSGTITSIGYVTPGNRFIRYSQASTSPEQLTRFHLGSDAVVEGSRNVAGQEWTVYQAPDSEPLWLTDLGGARISMTGSANEEEFTAMAQAIATAPPR